MTRVFCWLLVGFTITGLALAQGKESAAFDKLRNLAGDWEGSFTWSGGRTDSGKMEAQYYATGNGSAVVENLISNGNPVMTSVYHLDGSDLRMTHFCAAQNQPRLKATMIDLDRGQLTFDFVDITNLRSPTTGHVEGLEIRFLQPDRVNLHFRFKGNSKESNELIDLTRKK